MADYHLAQVNIARMRAPLEDPLMADFVAALDTVNAEAEQSPGFVWRLEDDTGSATSIRVFDDDRILVNMSVWESVEALRAYVYRGDHVAALRRRKEWFGKLSGPHLALWWIPAGHRPSLEEAKARLEHLAENGASAEAFTFQHVFPAPESYAESNALHRSV